MRNEIYHWSKLLEKDIGVYLERTWQLIERADFKGFDPGSIRSEKFERFLLEQKHPFAKLWNLIFCKLFQLSGYDGIKRLNLPKIRSTKAIALCASGIAFLNQTPFKEKFIQQGLLLLDRLLCIRNSETGVWHADFRYRIHHNIVSPQQPGLVNSLFAAEAFWDWFMITNDDRYSSIFIKVGEDLLNLIPRFEKEKKCCFTYNPATKYYVHNTNMMLASLLTRLSYLKGGIKFLDCIVMKCLNYTLEDIERNRAVYYASYPTPNKTVDNYHTGYILRALKKIYLYPPQGLDIRRLKFFINYILNFYLFNFIDESGVYRESKKRRIQTHSLAEALIIYGDFYKENAAEFNIRFVKGVRSSFNTLWDPDKNYFINEIIRLPFGLKRYDITPMVRWSWSWMFYALAKLIAFEINNDQ